MIVAAPFAFVVSLIRQPITSSRMWTSFLFTVLASSWLGYLSTMLLMATGKFPGMGAIAAGMGMVVSYFASIMLPFFTGSLRNAKK
jgi:hypothetical protein